jgi:hypothetical protein
MSAFSGWAGRSALLAILVVVTVLSLGCGNAELKEIQDNPIKGELSNLGLSYSIFQGTTGKPPKSYMEVSNMPGVPPGGLAGAGPDQVTVFWGVPMADTLEGPSPTVSDKVLAYEKAVPESGGYVLLLDRRVVKMTAAEFASAPKAGTLPPADAKAK